MSNLQSVLTFNGTSDYIELAYTPALNPAQFTLSCWARVMGGQGQWRSLITSRAATFEGYILYAGQDNKWQFWTGDGSSWKVVSGAAIALNTWIHIAATYDGSTMRFYLDGQPAGTPLATSLQPNIANPVRIGAGVSESATPGTFFNGQIAELRLWNRARSQTEIAQDMGRRLQGTEADFSAYWPLNEGGGTIALDRSGNGHSAPLNGGTWSQEILSFLNPLPVTLPIALAFDGTDDSIDCGSGIDLANKSFTIECWVKSTAVNKARYIVSQGQSSTNQGLYLGFRSSNAFTLAFWGNSLDTDLTYTDNNWHHWSCVYDLASNQQLIYRDGEKVGSRQADAPYQGTGNFLIGLRNIGGNFLFEGELVELRIWQYARTQAEIQADMHYMLAGDEANLLTYWPLNEGAGFAVEDRSGNGHNGIITGTAIWQPTDVPLSLADPQRRLQLLLPALSFDGVNDYVDCGSGINLSYTSFTIEAYVQHERLSQDRMFLHQGQRSQSQGLSLGFRASNAFAFSFWNDALDTPFPCLDRCWHHWSCVYDLARNERIIYRDGKEVARDTAIVPYQGAGTVYLGFGAGDPGTGDMEQFFQGKLVELRVWTYARTGAEIQSTLNARLTGNEAYLAAYWPLNTGGGAIATDKSRNGHNGTIVGALWTGLQRSPGTGLADYGYWYRWQQNLPLHLYPPASPSFVRGRIWA